MHNKTTTGVWLVSFREDWVINRIYIYCPVVTEKSTNPSVKINFVHAEACQGMEKLIWHEG